MNKKINLKCYFLYRELSTRINMHRYNSNIIPANGVPRGLCLFV